MNRRDLLKSLSTLGIVTLVTTPFAHAQTPEPKQKSVPTPTSTPPIPTPAPTQPPYPSPVTFDEASFMVIARSLIDVERELYKALNKPFSSTAAQLQIYMDAVAAVRMGISPWYFDFWDRAKALRSGVRAEAVFDNTWEAKV